MSLRNLPATMANLIEPGSDHPFPGRSLARTWSDDRATRPDPVLSQLEEPALRGADFRTENVTEVDSLIAEDHVLIDGRNRTPELYELFKDTRQERNLANNSAERVRLERMMRTLNASPSRYPTVAVIPLLGPTAADDRPVQLWSRSGRSFTRPAYVLLPGAWFEYDRSHGCAGGSAKLRIPTPDAEVSMKDPQLDWERGPDWESGLASTLIGGFLMIAAAVGIVFNILLASVSRSIMGQSDARLHGLSTTIVLACVFWTAACGLRLSVRGRGGLAVAGRSLGVAAVVMWLVFAIGQAFVLVPMW